MFQRPLESAFETSKVDMQLWDHAGEVKCTLPDSK